MSTEIKATRSGIVPYRVTVRQFIRMIDAGIFPEGHHVELLGGLLVDKMTKNDPHNYAVDGLCEALRRLPIEGWVVREEKSVRLGPFWRPEPDVALVRGPRDRYRSRAPQADDLALLVEVADASLVKDRGVKCRRYAAAGVSAYWIVDLGRRQVQVFGGPTGHGDEARFTEEATFDGDAEVPVVIEGREVGRIAVRDLLS